MRLRALILPAVLGLLLAAAAPPQATAQMRAVREKYVARFMHQKAPDFVLPDLLGGTVQLSDYLGQPVLLNFWYSGCVPCRRETPDLATLYRMYRRKGLVILGVNLDAIIIPDSGDAQLRKFLQTIEVPYPILRGDEKVFDAYGQVPAQPTSFLIDREGKIEEVFWGARPGRVFDEAVRPYVNDGKAAHP